MHFIEKFYRENIDGQHLRPPVLAILLETIERENFDGLLALSVKSVIKYCTNVSYQLTGRKSNPICLAVKIPYRTHSSLDTTSRIMQ